MSGASKYNVDAKTQKVDDARLERSSSSWGSEFRFKVRERRKKRVEVGVYVVVKVI